MFIRIIELTFALAVLSAGAAEKRFDLGELKTNETPRGFRSVVTGLGQPGEWKLIMEEVAPAFASASPSGRIVTQRPALAQLSRDATDEHFPLLIYDEDSYGDFTIRTRFKLVDGKEEQMAGLAFRIQDEKNYYYIRASALGNTFAFFRYQNGVRSDPVAVKVEIPTGVWHELTVECKGNQIRGSLNGQVVLPQVNDVAFAKGKIGFWTKSDSVSYFSDTVIQYTPLEVFAQALLRDAFKQFPRLVGLKVFASQGGPAAARLVASNDASDIGKAAGETERAVIARNAVGYEKAGETVVVTLPLHDANGDT
ncbi:MAG TPA: family 16 glycoside hydrolase, partial [Verrucomicrobiae bacterium]